MDNAWFMLAQVGRHGRQPIEWLIDLPVPDLYGYIRGLNRLLREEAKRAGPGQGMADELV